MHVFARPIQMHRQRTIVIMGLIRCLPQKCSISNYIQRHISNSVRKTIAGKTQIRTLAKWCLAPKSQRTNEKWRAIEDLC